MLEFIEVPASKLSLAQRKPIYGVGINDASYLTSSLADGVRKRCPYYQTWTAMLTRCYSSNYHKKQVTYIGCSVSEDWLVFSNFKGWMLEQDWYNKVLDKDLLVIGNKVYSSTTCLFVTQELNNLLNTKEAYTGLYERGVYWHKRDKKFAARCNILGKMKPLGYFSTEEEASQAYRSFKYFYITSVAQEQTNQQLKEALLRHASLYLDEVC
jgi:hypothetical protein